MREGTSIGQRLADGVALLWLAAVGAAYFYLAQQPLDPDRSPTRAPLAPYDGLALALLAGVLLAGIIRCLAQSRRRQPEGARGAGSPAAAETARDNA